MAFLNSCSVMQVNCENAKALHNLNGSASTLYFFFFFFSSNSSQGKSIYLGYSTEFFISGLEIQCWWDIGCGMGAEEMWVVHQTDRVFLGVESMPKCFWFSFMFFPLWCTWASGALWTGVWVVAAGWTADNFLSSGINPQLFGELAPCYGVSRAEYMVLSWWEKWVKLGCVEWLQTHSLGLLASKSVSFVQTPLCHEQSVIKVGKCLGITEFFIAIPTETLWAFL